MKKILYFIITTMLLISFSSIAYAKPNNEKKQHGKQVKQEKQWKNKISDKKDREDEDVKVTEVTTTVNQNQATVYNSKKVNVKKNYKAKKQEFKINGSPVIKYGKFKLPIRPITQGMGATVTFHKETAILTVTKAATLITIDFKQKTVTVNGVADTTSGIFNVKNDKKMNVLIKYIAKTLGLKADCNKDKVTVEVPKPDTKVPTIASIQSAVYNATGSAITIKVAGASDKGDKVDVTKISLVDTTNGKTYQLTNTVGTGSTGVVVNEETITITLGSADKLGLTGFSEVLLLNIAEGSLLSDAAGNHSIALAAIKNIPVTIIK